MYYVFQKKSLVFHLVQLEVFLFMKLKFLLLIQGRLDSDGFPYLHLKALENYHYQ